jgi:pyruvate/2-oxoglutarate dehydrogenase complex dihydrolipoamide dehydrogenase (E3) component
MTDQEARGAGRRIDSPKLDYSKVCPAADVMGEPDGIAKVIFDAGTGLILGAHIFGAGAPELVQEISFAMHGGMTLRQLVRLSSCSPLILMFCSGCFFLNPKTHKDPEE